MQKLFHSRICYVTAIATWQEKQIANQFLIVSTLFLQFLFFLFIYEFMFCRDEPYLFGKMPL